LKQVPKKADLTNVGIGSVGYIFTPNALKAFRDDNMETKAPTNKFSKVPSVVISENIAEGNDFFFPWKQKAKQKRKERNDPVKSQKPDMGPIPAMQKGLSYPGAQASRSFAQHTFKQLVGPSGQAYLQQVTQTKPNQTKPNQTKPN
jgi:hypothetical protein